MKIKISQLTAQHFSDYETDITKLEESVKAIERSKKVSFISNSSLQNLTPKQYDKIEELFAKLSQSWKLEAIVRYKDL